jgi:hypothetical protein
VLTGRSRSVHLAVVFVPALVLAGLATAGSYAVDGTVGAASRRGWSRLPDPPFTRSSSVRVWTGRDLLIWAGAEPNGAFPADGAAYTAGSRHWRPIPPAPIPGRADPAAVWTGSELLVWGGWGYGGRAFGEGAGFDPARRSWRALPPAPLSARAPAAWTWTGKEFLVWGNTARLRTVRDGAAYNPTTNTWRRLPLAPLDLNQASALWLAGEMIVFGSHLDDGNNSSTTYAQGMTYTPTTNRWHTLASFPLSPQASTAAALNGNAISWDYLLGAASYDTRSRQWTRLPNLPLRASECYPSSATVASLVLGWYCGTGAIFDPAANHWQRLRPPPSAPSLERPVGAGRTAFFLGISTGGSHTQLWAYTPS